MPENEDKDVGFASMGKRIDDLKTGNGTEDAKAWEQATEDPQQPKQESVKQETSQEVNTSTANKKTKPSFLLSSDKIVLGIIGLFILILLFSKLSNNTGGSGSNQNIPPSAPSNNQPNYPSSVAITRLNEEMPPVGSGHSLSTPQIRYCVYQEKRLDMVKSLLDATNNYHVSKFNELVNDYNARCSSYRYRRGSLQSVQQELGNANSQLKEEAKQTVSSWGYSYSRQNSGTIDNTQNNFKPSPVPTETPPQTRYSGVQNTYRNKRENTSTSSKLKENVRVRSQKPEMREWIDEQGVKHWSGNTE